MQEDDTVYSFAENGVHVWVDNFVICVKVGNKERDTVPISDAEALRLAETLLRLARGDEE